MTNVLILGANGHLELVDLDKTDDYRRLQTMFADDKG